MRPSTSPSTDMIDLKPFLVGFKDHEWAVWFADDIVRTGLYKASIWKSESLYLDRGPWMVEVFPKVRRRK